MRFACFRDAWCSCKLSLHWQTAVHPPSPSPSHPHHHPHLPLILRLVYQKANSLCLTLWPTLTRDLNTGHQACGVTVTFVQPSKWWSPERSALIVFLCCLSSAANGYLSARCVFLSSASLWWDCLLTMPLVPAPHLCVCWRHEGKSTEAAGDEHTHTESGKVRRPPYD